ncbi:MAG: hypothetical protein J7L25_08310, partial [Deltaproteobacteria bacterium]|nr:hypothetical protein [Candidatus Tharpella aukensis]
SLIGVRVKLNCQIATFYLFWFTLFYNLKYDYPQYLTLFCISQRFLCGENAFYFPQRCIGTEKNRNANSHHVSFVLNINVSGGVGRLIQ